MSVFRFLFSLNILSLLPSIVAAQDLHFTQYYATPQLINPSACATISSFEAGLLYRSQWKTVTNAYTSYAAYISGQLKTSKSARSNYIGIGLNASYDRSGDGSLSTVDIVIPVNYQVRLNQNNFFSSGLSLGFGQRTLNPDKFHWGNQFDGFQYNTGLPSYEFNTKLNAIAFDAGLGFSWIYKSERKNVTEIDQNKNIFGLSAAHVNRPSYSLTSYGTDRSLVRYNLYEYCHLNFKNSDFSIIPNIMVQLQGPHYEIMIGNYFRYQLNQDSRITGYKTGNAIGFGCYYRFNDAIAFNTILEWKQYCIGLAYDVNLSKFTSTSRGLGGMEILLKMNGGFDYLYKGFSKF